MIKNLFILKLKAFFIVIIELPSRTRKKQQEQFLEAVKRRPRPRKVYYYGLQIIYFKGD